MKKTTLVIAVLLNVLVQAQTQQCIDFSQYNAQNLDSISQTLSPGGVILQEGDIKLLKGDVNFVSILSIDQNNALNYTSDYGGIVIDVSASNYNCKKLTYKSLHEKLIVDNDTIDFFSNTFPFQGNGYTVDVQGNGFTIVTGVFDQVTPFIQTNILSDICLDECSVPSNCFDFGQYTTSSLGAIVSNSQTGDLIAQQGDIKLIYGDVPFLSIDNVDSLNNQLMYNSGGFAGGIAIDVSSSNYSCKKLTFNAIVSPIIVDNDTIDMTAMNNYTGAGFSITHTNGYVITGSFDIVTPILSTNVLSNICLEDCSNSTVSENTNISEFSIYPNPNTTSTINLKGNIENIESFFITNMLGETILSGQLNSNSINIDNLKNGQYIVVFITKENKMITHKLIKM